VRLEVTAQTTPCARMDETWPGLRRALAPDWRGGVTARVITGGAIALGDPVRVVSEVAPPKVHLPG
jgi:MOSC domain-containing protein YiiM